MYSLDINGCASYNGILVVAAADRVLACDWVGRTSNLVTFLLLILGFVGLPSSTLLTATREPALRSIVHSDLLSKVHGPHRDDRDGSVPTVSDLVKLRVRRAAVVDKPHERSHLQGG